VTLMNEDIVKGKLKELQGRIQEQWGEITDDEFDKTEGQKDRLLGLLQTKYGYSKEKAETAFKDLLDKK
jgi:Uncharacterized protein conserved in bacteria